MPLPTDTWLFPVLHADKPLSTVRTSVSVDLYTLSRGMSGDAVRDRGCALVTFTAIPRSLSTVAARL